MGKDQFSNDKIFFYPDRIKRVLDGKLTEPVVYELSLSGQCNCNCQYCCCKYFQSKDMLTKNQIDLVVEEIAANCGEAVTITGGGEPLMNPFFGYCVRKLALAGLSVGVITNGLLLNNEKIDAIARHTSFCRISLDTVNELAYEELRGTSFSHTLFRKTLKKLVNKRDEYNSKTLIGAQIVYLDQADYDIEGTVLFCKECGVDFLQIRPVDNITGESLIPQYEFYQNKKKFLHDLKKTYSTNKFSVIINQNKFHEYDTQSIGKSYKQCLGGNFTIAIGHDMQVYFCCSNIGNPKLALGDLKTKSLQDILMSDKRKRMIENPNSQFCQMQCRNHKINQILNTLKSVSKSQAEQEILQKQKGEMPIHCEFL